MIAAIHGILDQSLQRSLYFDGVNDYAQAQNWTWSYTGPISFEYELFLVTGEISTGSLFQMTAGNISESANRWNIHSPYTDGNLYWDYGNVDNGTGRISASYAGRYDRWTKVRVESAGAGGAWKAIYYDGVLAASSTGATTGPNITINTFWFSRPFSTGANNRSRIRNVKIWRGLVSQGFSTIYRYWPLTESTVEATGSGNNLTLFNGAAIQ